jgi:hypothetical protein
MTAVLQVAALATERATCRSAQGQSLEHAADEAPCYISAQLCTHGSSLDTIPLMYLRLLQGNCFGTGSNPDWRGQASFWQRVRVIRIPPKDWSDRSRHAGNKTMAGGAHLQEVVTEMSQVHCCLAGFLR